MRTGIAAGHRLRASFVATQVALALVLLAGAGLVLRSFQKLVAVDPGFRTERVLSMSLWFAPAQFGDAAKRSAYLGRILDEVQVEPRSGRGLFGALPAPHREHLGLVLRPRRGSSPRSSTTPRSPRCSW